MVDTCSFTYSFVVFSSFMIVIMSWSAFLAVFFFFSSRRRHTRCALVTGVQTCALPISALLPSVRRHPQYPFSPTRALITPRAELHHPESQHRVGNLLESRGIGALHIVDIAIALIAIGQAAPVDPIHNILQHPQIEKPSWRERGCQHG